MPSNYEVIFLDPFFFFFCPFESEFANRIVLSLPVNWTEMKNEHTQFQFLLFWNTTTIQIPNYMRQNF